MAVYDPVLDWLGRGLLSIFNFFRDLSAKVTALVVAPFVGFCLMISNFINAVESKFNAMIDVATDAVGAAVGLNLSTSFGIANSFVPLDLMFEYAALLVPLLLVALLYRAVKSWIPTVS